MPKDQEISSPLTPIDLKPVEDQKISDLHSDFLAWGGIVKDRLPNVSEVRDMTSIVLVKDGVKSLYMSIDGKWELIKIISPTYDDLRFPISALKADATNPPNAVAYKSSLVYGFPYTGSALKAYFIAQLPHSWIEGTPLDLHLHWTIPTSGAGGGSQQVKWTITHSWANIGDYFPTATSLSITESVENITLDKQILSDFASIADDKKKISSVILFSITRDTTIGLTNYLYDAYLIEVDIHYQSRNEGSEEEMKQQKVIF